MSVFVFEEGGGSGGDRKKTCQSSSQKNKISASKQSDVDSGVASLCSSEISVNSKVTKWNLSRVW